MYTRDEWGKPTVEYTLKEAFQLLYSKLNGEDPAYYDKSLIEVTLSSHMGDMPMTEAYLISLFVAQNGVASIDYILHFEKIILARTDKNAFSILQHLEDCQIVSSYIDTNSVQYYVLRETVMRAINNNGYVNALSTFAPNNEELKRIINKIRIRLATKEIGVDEYIASMNYTMRRNQHLTLCRSVYEEGIHLLSQEVILAYYVCLAKTLQEGLTMLALPGCGLEEYGINQGINELVRLGIMQYRQKTVLDDDGESYQEDGYIFTKHYCAFFKEMPELVDDSDLVRTAKHIASSQIKNKQLFFPIQTYKTLHKLTKLLSPEEYPKVQAALQAHGFGTGFIELFHGLPGTGKTEFALQLARDTGRDLFMVDVSRLNNKFVGDSEKAYTSLFEAYNTIVATSAVTPILFLNEADAIISKRLQDVNSNTDALHNTIQNILLQALENFEGILIATTNLVTNIDKAFDRRILGKVEFPLPDESCRFKIWKHFLSDLPDAWLKDVSRKFVLSGGEIENIAKNFFLATFLDTEEMTRENLIALCQQDGYRQEEHLPKTRKIGYNTI